MNKQELIEKLAKRISPLEDFRGISGFHDGNYEGLEYALNLLQQLDEPQKPVVPQFVADWFEEHKDDLEFSIWELCVDSFNSTKKGMLYWIQQPENNPIETLVRMLDGYEVEKEPVYYIRLPVPNNTIVGLYLGFNREGEFDHSYGKPHITWGWKYTFTETEIKAMDERYWAFAVPVDEVVEG